MPPQTPRLHVRGIARCRTFGCRVQLMRHAPQGSNARDLLLDVREECGPQAPQAFQDVPLEYDEETQPTQFETVTIQPDGGTKKIEIVS